MIVDDFKNTKGLWVKVVAKTDGTRIQTKAARLYWSMLSRCKRGGSVQSNFPSYVGSECAFKDFQEFAEWCQSQVGYRAEGFHLDKDLLSRNLKVYSQDTCVFLPFQINSLLIKCDRKRGRYPIGVSRERNRFRAQCNVGEGGKEYLGSYTTPKDAFHAYKAYKEEFIKQQADKWKNQIDPRAYEALMKYQVEITD